MKDDPDLCDRRAAAELTLINVRWIWPSIILTAGFAPFAARSRWCLLGLAVACLFVFIGAWKAMGIVGRSLRESERRIREEGENRERKDPPL